MADRIIVVGLPAPGAPPAASLYVGGPRLLGLITPPDGARTLSIGAELEPVLDAIASEPGTVVVLAVAMGKRVYATSRDPGKRQRIAELGATALEPGARLPERVDVVIESVGAATFDHSMKSSSNWIPISQRLVPRVGSSPVAMKPP